MKRIFAFVFIISTLSVFGQDEFQFEKDVDKVIIPFQLINNLMFIPMKLKQF